MKTTLTRSLGLIGRFLKRAVVTTILLVVFIVGIDIIYYFCNSMDNIEYESKESLIAVFCENEQDFSDMVVFLKKTQVLDELHRMFLQAEKVTIFTKGAESLTQPKIQLRGTNLLTKDESEYLYSFFEKYGPYSVSRRKGYISFRFYVTNDTSVLIYYIEPQYQDETAYYLNQTFDLKSICDNWYYT